MDEQERTQLDEATRRRLSRLASRPVDTTGAASRIRAEIERLRPARQRFSLPGWSGWTRRGVAAAAVLAAAAALTFVLSESGSAVYAAPSEMVNLHQDLLAGRVPVVPVADIAEAQRVIGSRWRAAPALPEQWDAHVHACCLRDVQSRQVACLLMNVDGTPVTVVVARTRDFQLPQGEAVDRGGQRFVVTSRDDIEMVMTQHGDRWVCLMGQTPRERLLSMAEKLGGATGER